ncbi:MAG: hypothetical protein JWP76_6023, partial [Dactylosporangium sp.]|nr:hypothetical protein [Dactylosporangium sp.]
AATGTEAATAAATGTTGATAAATGTATEATAATTWTTGATAATRTATRTGRALAGHLGGVGPRRHGSRVRPRRHGSRVRPGHAGRSRPLAAACRVDPERVVAAATSRRTSTGTRRRSRARSHGRRGRRRRTRARARSGTAGRGLPANGLALPRGLLGGLDLSFLLGLEREGSGLSGRHLDVVRARLLDHGGLRPRRAGNRGPLRRRRRLRCAPGGCRPGRHLGLADGRYGGRRRRHGGGGRSGWCRRPRFIGRTQTAGDWRLDRAGRGLHKLAHLLELGEYVLTFDPELFS